MLEVTHIPSARLSGFPNQPTWILLYSHRLESGTASILGMAAPLNQDADTRFSPSLCLANIYTYTQTHMCVCVQISACIYIYIYTYMSGSLSLSLCNYDSDGYSLGRRPVHPHQLLVSWALAQGSNLARAKGSSLCLREARFRAVPTEQLFVTERLRAPLRGKVLAVQTILGLSFFLQP